MRRVAILFSHLGSGSGIVFDALARHPRIDGFRTGQTYDHYDRIVELTTNRHKNENASAIWLDEVLHNHQFTCKPILEHVKPIFVLREPRGSLADILDSRPEYDAERAANYYCYRLRGLCEYAHRAKAPFIIIYDEMSITGLDAYLGVKGVERPVPIIGRITDVPHQILGRCEASYEKHVGHIRQVDT